MDSNENKKNNLSTHQEETGKRAENHVTKNEYDDRYKSGRKVTGNSSKTSKISKIGDYDKTFDKFLNKQKHRNNKNKNKGNKGKNRKDKSKKDVNKPVYGQWSRWTRCSRKCKQTRRRKCKKPEICGKTVVKVSKCSNETANQS